MLLAVGALAGAQAQPSAGVHLPDPTKLFFPSCNLSAADARAAGPGCALAWFDANLAINEIQTVGTAESYKSRPSDQMMGLIKMGSDADAQALNFGEPPLAAQLAAGGRSFIFDVAYDPKGGLFKYPAGASMAGELVADDYVKAMTGPGFKVIHILDIDFSGTCLTLSACLTQIADWSRKNPAHLPIVITLHSNDERTPMPGATRPAKFDAAAFDALDKEILSVFKPEELITPDQVQGSYPSLREAVMAHAWPRLGKARGKVIFLLDDTAAKTTLYRGQRKGLEGRPMFVAADAASPVAAFVSIENPAKDNKAVTDKVKAGFIVHTFADADTREARKNDVLRRDWALASGAQVISTDFLLADSQVGPYRVRIPGNRVAQCNVQLKPERCIGLDVESGGPPAP